MFINLFIPNQGGHLQTSLNPPTAVQPQSSSSTNPTAPLPYSLLKPIQPKIQQEQTQAMQADQ